MALSVKECLLSNVRQNGECIDHTYSLSRVTKGYPRIEYMGHKYCTHILAWALVNGDPPEGLEVHHSCDNTRCININHLSVGTHAENMRQAVERNRTSHDPVHSLVKISKEDYEDIQGFRDIGMPVKQIADIYGVTIYRIYQITKPKDNL